MLLSVSIAILAASALDSATSATEVTATEDLELGATEDLELGTTEERRMGAGCPQSLPEQWTQCSHKNLICYYLYGTLAENYPNVLDTPGGARAMCSMGRMGQAWSLVRADLKHACPYFQPDNMSQCSKYMTCGYVHNKLAESFVDVLRTPGGVQAVCRMGRMGNAWYNQQAKPENGPIVYGRRLDEATEALELGATEDLELGTTEERRMGAGCPQSLPEQWTQCSHKNLICYYLYGSLAENYPNVLDTPGGARAMCSMGRMGQAWSLVRADLKHACPYFQPENMSQCRKYMTCGYVNNKLAESFVDVLRTPGGVQAVCRMGRMGNAWYNQDAKPEHGPIVRYGRRLDEATEDLELGAEERRMGAGCPYFKPRNWSQCRNYMTCDYVNGKRAQSFVDVLRTPGGVQAVCRMGRMGNAWYNQEAKPDHGPIVYGRRLNEDRRRFGSEMDCPKSQPQAHDNCYNWATCGYVQGSLVTSGDGVDVLTWDGGVKAECKPTGNDFSAQGWEWTVTGPRPPTPKPTGCPQYLPENMSQCNKYMTCGYVNGKLAESFVDVLRTPGGVRAVCRMGRMGNAWYNQEAKPDHGPIVYGRRLHEECPYWLPEDMSQCHQYMTCGYVNDKLAESFVDVLRTPGGVQAVCRMGRMGNAWYNQKARPDHGPIVYGRRLDEDDATDGDSTDATIDPDSTDATKNADSTDASGADELVAPTGNSAKDPKHVAALALANFYAMTAGIGAHTKRGQQLIQLRRGALDQLLSTSDDQLQSQLTGIKLLITPVLGKNTAAKAVEQLKIAYHTMKENNLAIQKQSESWVGVSQLAGLVHDGKVDKAEGLNDLTDAISILIVKSDQPESAGDASSQLEVDLAAVNGN